MTYTVPTFDELLNNILTDYRNQGGTLSGETVLREGCLAVAIWGAYKYQEYIAKQPFPDTADTENLNHHGAVQDIPRNAGEEDADYLARILDDIQNPSAGGNLYDYRKWAEEISGVARAYPVALAQGDGTVDVVVVADIDLTGSELPSASMRKGTATTITALKLIDATADFTAALAVSVGDIVRNTFQGTEARVVTIDSATQLTIDTDIFRFVGEHYHVHLHSGSSTTATAGKLIDSAGAFTNANYIVKKGDVVKNLTDDTEAVVVSVDSATQLTLDTDIFIAIGKGYVVESILARVKENIDANRLVTASRVTIFSPTILTQDVTMGVAGLNVDRAKIAADITALLSGYIPDQKFYLAQITTLAIERGAEDALVTTPEAFPVTPATYQMIRPGTVTVT
jgi:uncharacterized phage protein gp47/JayE